MARGLSVRPVPDWVPLGDRAIRFPRPVGVPPRRLLDDLRALPGVIDVVVAREDVALYFDRPAELDPSVLRDLARYTGESSDGRTIEIGVVYDGPDLESVAAATGLSSVDVARVHAQATYEVETVGFAPGFAYLIGLDPRLHLPRRATPRTRVPAGSLAIADRYTGVYPFESPGGWHLIGRVVGVRMFGPDGALLQLGDRVRFVP